MKKSSIPSFLCALLLVSFVSGGFVEEASAQSTEKKGKVASKVKNLDLAHPSPSVGNRSAAMISWLYAGSGSKGAKWFVTVYFFREFENFTCRVYRTKNGKASGKPISLPKKSLVVGYHKFKINTRSLKPILKCQESDSMPQTLAEVKEIDEMPVTPALTIGDNGPADTTQQDRDRGWKLVEAGVVGVAGTRGSSSSSLSNDPNRYSGSNTTAHALHGTADALGFLSLLLGSVGSSAKSTIHADIYFFEPVEALFCQIYYNGNKAKKRGTKIGVLKTLPDKRSKKTGLIKGLLSFDMKGPGKKNPPPMRVVCAGDKKDLPKKLPLEVSENLQAVDVFAKR